MKKYVFKPYSAIFPKLFEAEKKRLIASLGKEAMIVHIGSTAVPGLGGKGIIDIAIAVLKERLEAVSKQLESLGYAFQPAFSTPDRFYFVATLPDPEENVRRYHIHLMYPESREWDEFIAFREYLKTHPQDAKEYEELKKQAVIQAHGDGAKYRKIKEPFFKKIASIIRNGK